ncbi:MAG: hypothetical protein IJ685_11645 [Selenomonadaceae bacterium]|nr:hypothetical protein [Selenomonadaceae bacterium]
MIRLNELPLDFEPRRKILPKLPAFDGEPEMSEFESAFLCGALKTFRPKKILEVGVAGGRFHCDNLAGIRRHRHAVRNVFNRRSFNVLSR